MPRPTSSHGRFLTATAVCLMALGAAGCGDSSEGDTAPSDRASTATETATPPNAGAPESPKPLATGDRKDGSSSARQPSPPAADDKPNGDSTGGQEEREVAHVVEGMYRDLAESDAKGVCSVMSVTAREQIAQQVPGGSTEAPSERTCEKSMSAFLDAAARSGTLERTLGAKVSEVSIDGPTAAVTVSFGGTPGRIVLRKENGSWRFGPNAVAPRP